jgi:hypothetical protein
MKLLTFGFNLLLIFNLAIGPLQPVHAAPTQELAKSGPPTRIDGFGIDMSALPELNKENVDAIMQQIAATGALYIRQEIDWSLVETSPGVYDWSTAVPYDMLFAAADAQGIRIVAVLTGGPVYLAASGEPLNRSAVRERWVFFLQAAVERYSGYVDAWEIGGALNSAHALTPHLAPLSPSRAIGPHPGFYSKLLRSASEVIKDADPNDQVWLGSLSGFFASDCALNPLTYLLELNAAKSWKYFDAILYTPAQGSAAPERTASGTINSACASNLMTIPASLVEEVQAVQDLARQLGGKPVLVTGLGWGAAEVSALSAGREIPASQVEADLLVRASALLMGQNSVPLIFWHADILTNPNARDALINLQMSLHNAKPLGSTVSADSALYEVHFRKGGEQTLIAWRALDGDKVIPGTLQTADVPVITAWNTDAITMTRQSGTAYSSDGNGLVTIPLNERPVVLIGRSQDIIANLRDEVEDQAELAQIELGKLLQRGMNEAKSAFISLLEKEIDKAKHTALEWGEDKLDELLP